MRSHALTDPTYAAAAPGPGDHVIPSWVVPSFFAVTCGVAAILLIIYAPALARLEARRRGQRGLSPNRAPSTKAFYAAAAFSALYCAMFVLNAVDDSTRILRVESIFSAVAIPVAFVLTAGRSLLLRRRDQTPHVDPR